MKLINFCDSTGNYVEIKEKNVNNLRQYQFLESWRSEADKNQLTRGKNSLGC